MTQFIKIVFIINSIAAIHGVFLSIILITKKKNQIANKILALMVLLFSIGILFPLYVSSGIYIKLWWLSPFFNSLFYSFGPLLYMYIKSLTTPQFQLSKKYFLHMIPMALSLLYYSSIFFLPSKMHQNFLYETYFEINLISYISMFISLSQVLFYIILCFRLFRMHSKNIRKSYSELGNVSLIWIRHLVVLIIAIWITAVGLQSFLPEELIKTKMDDAITFFLLSLFIFTIGYRGLSQPEIFDLHPEKMTSENRAVKYEKTGLSIEKSIEVKNRLLLMMNESKPFTEPALTLPQLSNMMGLTIHQLSQVINDNMGQNFYRFINNYRVNEAKERLENSNSVDDKLVKIAFDSGFNSLSTFNRVFKDISGESPSQFRKTIIRVV